jgi:hypothetical protein
MYNYVPLYNRLDLTRVEAFCQWLSGSVTRKTDGEYEYKTEKLSGVCQVNNTISEFFYFGETHKTRAKYGGRGGIRTHGRVTPTPDFESGAFNHSATLPAQAR